MTFRERRIAAGFKSVGALSEASGIKRTRLYDIEIGRSSVSNLMPGVRKKLAKLLHCTVADLTARTSAAMTSVIKPCRVTKMEHDELEKMLAEKYGKKLQPLTPDAKRPVTYMLLSNDSYEGM